MKLIKTNQWSKDIDLIDTKLYGNPDGRTYQSSPIWHNGEIYIGYSDKIDFFARGKEILEFEPNNSKQRVRTKKAAKPQAVKPQEVKVHIEKPDPVEVKVDLSSIPQTPINVESPKVTVEVPEIKVPNIPKLEQPTVIIDTTAIAKEVAKITQEIAKLNRPWWKKIL